jgi:hypothetical protein
MQHQLMYRADGHLKSYHLEMERLTTVHLTRYIV